MTVGSDFRSSASLHNETAAAYFEHSSGQRVNTDALVVEALRREYPQLHLTVTPRFTCDLLGFAGTGKAAAAPIDKEADRLTWRQYIEPVRRLDGYNDGIAEIVLFGKYLLEFGGREFVVYIVNGRDGGSSYPQITNQYILSSSVQATEKLPIEAGRWTTSLHEEVWVFDQGFWQKSRELYDSILAAEWSNVILDEGMKKALIKDVDSFFDGRETYQKLKVPWKRGAIYYGPPGNGKTISIKAMMHSLYKRTPQVPTLYVKTLASYMGPEGAIKEIFKQARKFAPCYLIFEDLDTIITASVRSYFFNEVDGLRSNDGIFMIGSTNHLDQLDPGISKRPSRFDRKWYFPDPDETQRTAYAHFWQSKLETNKEIDFPDELCAAVAKITGGFSFAYMQEAFVASLLALAAHGHNDEDSKAQEPVSNGESPAAIAADWMVTMHPNATDLQCKTVVAAIKDPEAATVPLPLRFFRAPAITTAVAEVLSRLPGVARVQRLSNTPMDTILDWLFDASSGGFEKAQQEEKSGKLSASMPHSFMIKTSSGFLAEEAKSLVAQLNAVHPNCVVTDDQSHRIIFLNNVTWAQARQAALMKGVKKIEAVGFATEHAVALLQQLQLRETPLAREEDDLDRLPLWRELKKQVKTLREEMDKDTQS